MSDFRTSEDIAMMTELLGISASALAEKIGASPVTLSRWMKDDTQISPGNLKALYEFAFSSGLRLNQIKEQLYREDFASPGRPILFHGAKAGIEGPLDLQKSRSNNDLGRGFYCGESLIQSAMFVSGYRDSSLYIVSFDSEGLDGRELTVNRDWMLLIAYYRGKLDAYKASPLLQSLIASLAGADYIIAPIADNRMFEIIDEFIVGELTDEQCRHCLSATNLGRQYVFVTERALRKVTLLRHCYLCEAEKKFYLETRREETRVGNDKVKIARRQYRGAGLYIEEVLS